MEIDQNTAKKYLVEGATLIFIGVPIGTEFGIDMNSWNTDENFKGVKMIPNGVHYVHYSSVSKITGDTGPRMGFIHNFSKSEFLVLSWNSEIEDVIIKTPKGAELERLRSNLLNLDRYLAPYPFDILEKWKGLSSHVTGQVISKLTPKTGKINSALELVSCNDADRIHGKHKKLKNEDDPQPSTSKFSLDTTPSKRRASKPGVENSDDELLPDLKPVPGTELRLTAFPERNYPDGASPADITKHSLDSSYVLEFLLSSQKNPADIIGELQFCFICFYIGHSLEAFEHWKRLIHIICSCDEAIIKHRVVFDLFISVFEYQLLEVPEEFLADIVTNNNFVYQKLRELFCNIENSEVDGRLKSKANRFKESLTKKFLWDFTNLDDEDEDEAPVVVEI